MEKTREKRAVFFEKSWLDSTGAFGIYHYAVKVDGDWYEVVVDMEDGSSNTGNALRKAINGADLNGRPRLDKDRKTRTAGTLTCAGVTYMTDEEIWNFNRTWTEENSTYNEVFQNSQQYASDLIHYLAGGSCKMGLPLSAFGKWADGPGAHAVVQDGFYQARATTGKAGYQLDIVAAEAEGPSAGADVSQFYAGAEASLGRVEVQVLGVGARLEPNVNTGLGVTDGQFKAKAIGFGLTVGQGLAIHTPFGSLGFGRF